MTFNTKNLIDNSPLSRLQYATLIVCFFMNMLDGMDVLVISYAAPAISQNWGVSPQALGIVFSSGLFGMTAGALFLAPFADRIGRKNMILLSAALMGTTVYLTSFATSIYWLVVIRFVSGLGVGSMLASTAALAAEYTPHRTKDFWVSFVISGYPVGAVLSGLASGKIIVQDGWQSMFEIAGIITIVSLPVIYFFLTESLDFYIKKQPRGALEKINTILIKMGFEAIEAIPSKSSEQRQTSIQSLLNKEFRTPTLQLFFICLYRFSILQKQTIAQSDNRTLQYFQAFQKSVKQSLHETKPISQYAKELNITSVHLNRICQALVQKSALEIVHDYLINEAKKYLLNTNYSVSEVSYFLNFKDPAYFTRLFKKQTGVTPTDFRKN